MALIRAFLRMLLIAVYRVRVRGLEHYDQAGPRALIVANHTSFLDAVLLTAFLPDRLVFAVNTHVSRAWWIRPLFRLVELFPMDPTHPMALKELVHMLRRDERVVIFPEGRITVTGSLMKVYEGPGLVADKARAPVLPVRIDGAQYTPFSRLRGVVRLRWFPPVTVTLLPPRIIHVPEEVKGRARRAIAGRELTQLMGEMMFATTNTRRTVVEGVLDAMQVHGARHPVVEDLQRRPLPYRQLLARAFALGDRVTEGTEPGERVGLLLPNSAAGVVALLGLHLNGRVPAMLNYTAGPGAAEAAMIAADIGRVVTSRRFVEAARLEPLIEAVARRGRVIFLEDVGAAITPALKLRAALSARLPETAWRKRAGEVSPDDPAVVLFTSGSEGAPKGVVLSHHNLLSNMAQLAARVDFSARDLVLNALPMFHSFGLTGGTLLPLCHGIHTFFYPSPLHYRVVPEMAYEVNATILFGTNTFLAGYARTAHPYDFYSVRYVFAGAERLAEETRRVWAEKFGIRIFEGYGATETAPALSINTAMAYRAGSVGRLLPGIEYHLEPVPGIAEGGRLHVRGPNVMLGYLRTERPGVLEPPSSARGEGWYDTGDIVDIDGEGYVYIKGRAKRFAKVGGEMVSLTAAEQLATELWPDHGHAVVAVPDRAKGEKLVLLTEHAGARRAELLRHARSRGAGELLVPGDVRHVERLPLLGSGKTDYGAAEALARELAAPRKTRSAPAGRGKGGA